MVLSRSRGALITVGALSAAVNLLMLTGPLFMLQIYDRVLTSRAEATLVALLAIVVYLYGLMGLLNALRGRILARIGAGFQTALDERAFDATLRAEREPTFARAGGRALPQVETVRSFLASPAPGAILDLPWIPFFIIIIFIFHPLLGWLAIAGSIILLTLALANRWATSKPQASSAKLSIDAHIQAEDARREVETVRGLGMIEPLRARWRAVREAALDQAMRSADPSGGYTSASKAFRLLLQSLMLALGAWLVLEGELTAGAMIAASILLGRALQPLEQTVQQWSQIRAARASWRSLSDLLRSMPPETPPMELPKPVAILRARDMSVWAPNRRDVLLRDVNFEVTPGEAVAVIGRSGAGKSTLAKALVGLWPLKRGEIRLGGAELSAWGESLWRDHIGYLPQDVALFTGSVAENISRFDPRASEEDVIRAAIQAGAHGMILSLPNAYDTFLMGGGGLSGGQRQRIALARAFYGDPALLVLDEPDAHMAEAFGLNRAIAKMKADGRAAVVIAHRRASINECARVAVIEDGRLQLFGPREEVMARIEQNQVRQLPTVIKGGNRERAKDDDAPPPPPPPPMKPTSDG